MKKFLYLLLIMLASCSIALAQTSTEIETRQYAIDIVPGELYFLETKLFDAGEYTFTNNVMYMWYPERVETWFDSAVTSTNSLIHIYENTTDYYLDYQVVTNEFGNTATNWLHALTNSTTVYVTNTVASWTQTANKRGVATAADTAGYYIQSGDLLKYTTSNTNAVHVRLIGRR